MAIQMRRGLKKDFDQNKMLPGEWAVSIDSVTSNQIVWMCFAAGVCKRMGTYEDFYAQITEATKDIRDSYVSDFDEIKADIELIADVVSSNKEEVLIIKSDIVNTYLPQIQQYVSDAQMAASTATSKANSASESAVLSESYAVGGTGTRNGEDTDNAKYYADEAKKSAEKAVEIVGGDFLAKTGDASNTTVSFTKASTRSNIVSGEKQSTIFGKIMKWFADMTAAAFAQVILSYSDLMSNTVSGYIPDAKAVKDGFDTVDSNLVSISYVKNYWLKPVTEAVSATWIVAKDGTTSITKNYLANNHPIIVEVTIKGTSNISYVKVLCNYAGCLVIDSSAIYPSDANMPEVKFDDYNYLKLYSKGVLPQSYEYVVRISEFKY